MIYTDIVEAPDYWAPYLINGDATGYSDDELVDIEYWIKNNINCGWAIVSCQGEPEFKFKAYYSITQDRMLGANVVEYILHYIGDGINEDNNE